MFGSCRFIIIQTAIVAMWIAVNLIAVILLSQNRQANTYLVRAEHEYSVNQLALQSPADKWPRARKTDQADAASVAHAAIRRVRLRPVVAEDHTTQLRLLAERCGDLATEPVRVLHRFHVLFRELIPGGARRPDHREGRHTHARCAAAHQHRRMPSRVRRDLLADLRRLDWQLSASATSTRQALPAAHTTVTNIRGVGHILTGKILGPHRRPHTSSAP